VLAHSGRLARMPLEAPHTGGPLFSVVPLAASPACRGRSQGWPKATPEGLGLDAGHEPAEHLRARSDRPPEQATNGLGGDGAGCYWRVRFQ